MLFIFFRLHYLACNVQGYVKPLREDIRSKSKTDLKADTESKIKIMALKAATNISNMIKDLFHNPPKCKTEIPLSWKAPVVSESVSYVSVFFSTDVDIFLKNNNLFLQKFGNGKRYLLLDFVDNILNLQSHFKTMYHTFS